MLLYEKLISSLNHLLPNEVERQLIKRAELIMVDNIYEFFMQKGRMDLLEDCPNAAPPWPIAFYEYNMRPIPKKLSHRREIRTGTLITSEKPNENGPIKNFVRDRNLIDSDNSDIGWFCMGSTYVLYDGIDFVAPFSTIFPVLSNGCLVKIGENKVATWGGLRDDFDVSESRRQVIDEQGANKDLLIPLLANSFCHCKNVEVRTVDPSPKLSKKQERRYGQPKVSYKILEIHPMREILNREGGLSQHGSLKQALHICRGHFKDYRERGLFGKIKGMYWWDSHVRGSLEKGVAAKDYSVHDS